MYPPGCKHNRTRSRVEAGGGDGERGYRPPRPDNLSHGRKNPRPCCRPQPQQAALRSHFSSAMQWPLTSNAFGLRIRCCCAKQLVCRRFAGCVNGLSTAGRRDAGGFDVSTIVACPAPSTRRHAFTVLVRSCILTPRSPPPPVPIPCHLVPQAGADTPTSPQARNGRETCSHPPPTPQHPVSASPPRDGRRGPRPVPP